MTNETTHPVPLALKKLIQANTELLRIYQQELQAQIQAANLEMMDTLKLSPEDGWKLDIANMVYVQRLDTEE
jgi:hypothetical protein